MTVFLCHPVHFSLTWVQHPPYPETWIAPDDMWYEESTRPYNRKTDIHDILGPWLKLACFLEKQPIKSFLQHCFTDSHRNNVYGIVSKTFYQSTWQIHKIQFHVCGTHCQRWGPLKPAWAGTVILVLIFSASFQF